MRKSRVVTAGLNRMIITSSVGGELPTRHRYYSEYELAVMSAAKAENDRKAVEISKPLGRRPHPSLLDALRRKRRMKPQLFEPSYHKASGKPSVKRQLFKVIKDKTLALVRIDNPRDKYRRVAWEAKGNFTSLRATAAIIGGQRRNHSFFVFFNAKGGVSALDKTRQQLQPMLDCIRLPDPFLGYPSIEHMVEMVEGLIFAVEIETEYSDTRERECNTILGLSADPDHWAWESYHELVKLRGEEVPDCTLYGDSPSTKLIINRRLAATVVRENRLTLAQRHVKQGRKRSAVIRESRPQMDLVSLLEAG